MKHETKWIYNKSHQIEANVYRADAPKFACIVMHGMAEHSGRYHEFVSHLVENGGHVITYNHRGHGEHAHELGDIESMALLIDDANTVARLLPEALPKIIIGHSMGAIVARNMMLEGKFRAYVFIGTMAKSGIFDKLSLQLLKPLDLLYKDAKLKIVNYLALGVNDKSFEGNTANRWLSLNEENVHDFNNDDLAGFNMTTHSIYESLKYLQTAVSAKRLKQVKNNPKILIVSGADDAISRFGRDIHILASKYGDVSDDVFVHLYPKLRHEVLNEDNRETVFNNITDWIHRHV